MPGCPAHVKRPCETAAGKKRIRTLGDGFPRGMGRTPAYYGMNPGVPPSRAVNSAQTGRWAETAWSVNGFRS